MTDTADQDYQQWRLALHNKQIEIDNYDLATWDFIIDNNIADDEAAIDAKVAEREPGLAKLKEELEVLFRSDPRARLPYPGK